MSYELSEEGVLTITDTYGDSLQVFSSSSRLPLTSGLGVFYFFQEEEDKKTEVALSYKDARKLSKHLKRFLRDYKALEEDY